MRGPHTDENSMELNAFIIAAKAGLCAGRTTVECMDVSQSEENRERVCAQTQCECGEIVASKYVSEHFTTIMPSAESVRMDDAMCAQI